MNAETKVEVPTGLALLRQPFPPHQISKLPKPTKAQTEAVRNDYKKGIRCQICGTWHHPDVVHLDYVGHAALTDRLLDCDPHWTWEPVVEPGLPNPGNGMWIKLTVCGVSRIGYGHADGKTGGDAIKETIGDALRNAAMRFGAALDLWHKGDLHLADETPEQPEAEAQQGGHSQGGAVSPPAKRQREPEWDTPIKGKSALHKALTRLERELAGCGDSGMVYALTATQEWRDFVTTAEKHAPHYLRGGEPAPPEFEGLQNTAERMVREFDAAEANHMVDLARA